MANIKVSQMNEATAFEDGDYTMIVQANQNKKISKQNILGNIEDDVSTINTEISTINNNVGDITALETTDKSNLVSAINEITNFLNINTFETITTGTITGGGTLSGINITIEKNQDGSLAKIYGQIDVATTGKAGNVTFNTSLRPTSELSINGMVYRSISNGGYVRNNALVTMVIGTNGTITIPYVYTMGQGDSCRLSLINSLIFIKEFNQTEEEEE